MLYFQSVHESKNKVSDGFNAPLKQSSPVSSSKQVYTSPEDMLPIYMDYENLMLANELSAPLPTKYGDYSQPMSLKYAELCSVPKSSQYPELFTSPGQYDALFPVDTPNIIPNLVPPADFKQQGQVESNPQNAGSGSGSEMDYKFTDTDDLDLFSLLSLPVPANKEPDMYDCDPFMYGVQPSLEELDYLGSTMPDDIHYWNGFQKDSSNNNTDPVITGPYGKKREDDVSPTLESTLLLEGGSQAMSPVHSEVSLMSEDGMVPSNSPVASEKCDKGLRDLFERTFDLSDIEGDYMWPPPNKRQEAHSNSQYWSPEKKLQPPSFPSQYWSPERKPQLTPPPPSQHWASERKPQLPPPSPPPTPVKQIVASPSPQPMTSSPPPEQGNVKQGKNKPKPTLLFGKHEGEIIQKLLVTNNTRSKPIARDKLITIPVEEFNQLLEEAQLTEIEVAFMKEWRRRGKNKAAAQVARKRKREEVSGLDGEVEKMRQQKAELEKKYDQLRSLIQSLKERSAAAEDRLFQMQSENLMEPVSRNTHLIHVTDDNQLLLIPKISSKVLVVNS